MKRTLMTIAQAVVAASCGDDDAAPRDGGGGDDAAPAADLGDGRDELALRFALADADEAAVQGAYVTVDTPAGRFETETDADGLASLSVRVADGERMVFQYAKEGYRIDAVELDYDSAEPPPETIERVLAELVAGLGERATVSFALTGLPEGAHACTAFDGFAFCHPSDDATPSIAVPRALIGEEAGVFIVDSSDELHDFESVTLTESGSGFAASMTIDGTPAIAVEESRDLRLLVPEGESSRLADSELPEGWGWWGLESDPETNRFLNVCGRASRDGNAIVARCHFFDIAGTTNERVTVWADTQLMTQAGFTTRNFPTGGIPNETQLLGTAEASGGPTVTGTFEWTEPTLPSDVTGDRWYIARFTNSSAVVQQALFTQRASEVSLPALPDGYDREVSYPFAGAGGYLFVQSIVFEGSPLFDESPTLLLSSTSESHPITF